MCFSDRTTKSPISHAAGTLQRANEGLLRSKRTLAAISRRALGNKLLMWCMMLLLTVAILVLAWAQLFGFSGGSKASTDASGAHRSVPNATA